MSSPLSEDTRTIQQALADYCRSGEDELTSGVTPNRVPEYRRLVFNVVSTALVSTYPLTKNLLTTKEWANLVHDFFEQHDCQHPQVWRMPEELIAFFKDNQQSLQIKYPQIIDLLTLEWKEVELYMMPDKAFSNTTTADAWKASWVWNPEHELLSFKFPVHTQNARFISKTDQGEYNCLVFRTADKSAVRFFNLSPFLALFVSASTDNQSSPQDFLIEHSDLPISEEDAKASFALLFDKLKEDGAVF